MEKGDYMKKTIGVLAHVDAGKTTFSEQILYHTKVIRNRGRVDHKNSFLDSHDIEKDRVKLELKMFLERDMEKFLRFCIYFSDMIKKNNWVVGVGRGSSVASYCLYLLKIHLVDSIKYNLDIKEFLK